MLTNAQYVKTRARIDKYEDWRNGRQSISAIDGALAPVKVTNDERSAVEVFEFVKNPPARYFAYVKIYKQPKLGNAQLEADRYGLVTTWTGDTLGGIYWVGLPFRGNMGDKRINIRVRAINGRSYAGTYYTGAGDYCRLKVML